MAHISSTVFLQLKFLSQSKSVCILKTNRISVTVKYCTSAQGESLLKWELSVVGLMPSAIRKGTLWVAMRCLPG